MEKPPELIVEILTPSTAHKDRNLKYELYEEQGVKCYLIVDPITEIIEIYLLNESYQLARKIKKENADFDFSLKDFAFGLDFSKIW